MALMIQAANLLAAREPAYAYAWDLTVPQFEAKVKGLSLVTLALPVRIQFVNGLDMPSVPVGTLLFLDGDGTPKYNDVGWKIYRVIAPQGLRTAPGEQGTLIHPFSNFSTHLSWPPTAAPVQTRSLSVSLGPRRDWWGKFLHWMRIKK
jgi:hypothetical protein